MRPIIASDMPVLPLVGSKIVRAPLNSPSASACSIILSAMRSLTLPVGLAPSSLAKIRTPGLGLSRCNSTIGVSPIVSKMPLYVSFATISPCYAKSVTSLYSPAFLIIYPHYIPSP